MLLGLLRSTFFFFCWGNLNSARATMGCQSSSGQCSLLTHRLSLQWLDRHLTCCHNWRGQPWVLLLGGCDGIILYKRFWRRSAKWMHFSEFPCWRWVRCGWTLFMQIDYTWLYNILQRCDRCQYLRMSVLRHWPYRKQTLFAKTEPCCAYCSINPAEKRRKPERHAVRRCVA